MSSETTPAGNRPAPAAAPARPRRIRSGYSNLVAHGEPWIWLTSGSLAVALLMITGLLGLIAARGLTTFWPVPLERFELDDGRLLLGELAGHETADGGRTLVRVANFGITGKHFEWVNDRGIAKTDRPPWATAVERVEAGRFHGYPVAFYEDGRLVAEGPQAAWREFEEIHPDVRRRFRKARGIDKHERGRILRDLREARLAVVQAELDHGSESDARTAAARREREVQQRAAEESRQLDEATGRLREENDRYELELESVDGQKLKMPLAEIVRGWQPNQLSIFGRLAVYGERWWEFLSDDPRQANSAGGVFPAIWGTVAMTLIMAVFVAPFGVLAALYLREYAAAGPVTSAIRIAINNLAGVPSIVYGAFGLGFFCYVVGAGIDELFFEASLVADNQPVFGTGGLLWASLTLALLTLPVVIVATEEALASVPNSMREGSYACGAGKWQTIRRIVLPRALPGIMTGLILAMARGAGEVAPLMLVGVKKLAVDLPIDSVFPYVHPEREFMHLAYLIYDVGFQSPNSQAAQPMVFTITFLLVLIIAALNLLAIWIRGRLRRRFETQQF